MRQRNADALLLDVRDLHDGDRIVVFLTAEFGKKQGVARGAKRKYSRYAGQLQPLAKVAISWFEKDGRELVRIQDVAVLRTAESLHRSLEGILLGSYLAEHLVEFAQEDEASDRLFRLLDRTLEGMASGIDYALAARYFETWVLRLGGIFPPPRECPSCLEPFPADGACLPRGGDSLLCARCAREAPAGHRLDGEVLAFLMRTARESLKTMAERPPSPRVLECVERICGEIRRGFLHRELRSYEVMRRTLLEVG